MLPLRGHNGGHRLPDRLCRGGPDHQSPQAHIYRLGPLPQGAFRELPMAANLGSNSFLDCSRATAEKARAIYGSSDSCGCLPVVLSEAMATIDIPFEEAGDKKAAIKTYKRPANRPHRSESEGSLPGRNGALDGRSPGSCPGRARDGAEQSGSGEGGLRSRASVWHGCHGLRRPKSRNREGPEGSAWPSGV